MQFVCQFFAIGEDADRVIDLSGGFGVSALCSRLRAVT